MPRSRHKERAVTMIKFKHKNEAENCMLPEDPDEMSSETEDFIFDLQMSSCPHCGGKAYTIQFGKRVPCPYGFKRVVAHSNRIVCYQDWDETSGVAYTEAS